MPSHIRDMMPLQDKHPDIALQFSRGEVVHKTKRPFFSIAIDQVHDKVVKGDGGAVTKFKFENFRGPQFEVN